MSKPIDCDDTREEVIAVLRDRFNVTYEVVDAVATAINNMPPIEPKIVKCDECLYPSLCSWHHDGATFCSFAKENT